MPTVTIGVDVEITVTCNECGTDLDKDSTGGSEEICAAPCPVCLERARDEAKSAGYDEGYEEGKRIGHGEGYTEGYQDCEGDYK